MYLFTRPAISKIGSLGLLFIVTILGGSAHFKSLAIDIYKFKGFSEFCHEVSSCPSNALTMERFFVAFTIILVILSVINLIAPMFMEYNNNLKWADIGYLCAASFFLLVSASLILASASKMDRFMGKHYYTWNGNYPKRTELKYINKIFAGILGLLNSVLYLGTAWTVFSVK